jgi:hypothetical protein
MQHPFYETVSFWVFTVLFSLAVIVYAVKRIRAANRKHRDERSDRDQPFTEFAQLPAPAEGERCDHDESGMRLTVVTCELDQIERVAEQRIAAGRCIYCERPAECPHPDVISTLPLFHSAIRFLGGKPVLRWRAVERRGYHDRLACCLQHKDWSLGKCEAKAAEKASEQAKNDEKARYDVLRFSVYGLLRDIRTEMIRMRAECTTSAALPPRTESNGNGKSKGSVGGDIVPPGYEPMTQSGATLPSA